jgi:hypothetical protein
MSLPFKKFTQASCILMGAFTGALIALPIAGSLGPIPPPVAVVGFSTLGALVGYRRRNSHAFFYFSLFCVMVLSTLISFYLLAPTSMAPQP